MRKEHINDIELIFHAPCNNSIIDVVSGLNAKPTTFTSANWTNPQYVVDPSDSSRYVIKKKVGSYYVPIVPGLPALETALGTYPRFLFAKTTTVPSETDTYKFFDSYAGKSHRLEFDVYIRNYSTNRPFYMNGGLWNWNTNSQNNGYEIGIYNSKITVAWRNNVSTTSYSQYYTVTQVTGKWIRFTVDITEVDNTHYLCSSYMKILDGSLNDVQMDAVTLIKPGTSNRQLVTFFADHYGNGAWAANDYDYLRDIKIYSGIGE